MGANAALIDGPVAGPGVFCLPARQRGLEVTQDRADLLEPVRTVASPIRMSVTPVAYDRAPPALGQDTDEVLGPLRSDR